jgi:hypothetical protein
MNVRGDKRNLMLVPSFMFQSLDFKLIIVIIVVIVSIVLLVVLLRFFIFMFLMVKFVMTLTV